MSQIVWVSGGAGFLGRCTAEVLKGAGYEPFILDAYFTSSRSNIEGLRAAEIDLADAAQVRRQVASWPQPVAVFHFAARALVGESVHNPELYFRNNVLSTVNLAEAALAQGCRTFVHSSSCAIYGIPKNVPLLEDSAVGPISPYGESKRMAEGVLSQYAQFKGLKVLNLRYFNPVGSVAGKYGEAHDPETHLVPRVVEAIALGKTVPIFGTDYPTPDGTCIRDYLHVHDLADAHIAGLRTLKDQPAAGTWAVNLGSGRGASVKEVIQVAEEVLGKKAQIDLQPRRPGDPPALWADISAAKKLLGWAPQRTLTDAIRDHWSFLSRR